MACKYTAADSVKALNQIYLQLMERTPERSAGVPALSSSCSALPCTGAQEMWRLPLWTGGTAMLNVARKLSGVPHCSSRCICMRAVAHPLNSAPAAAPPCSLH